MKVNRKILSDDSRRAVIGLNNRCKPVDSLKIAGMLLILFIQTFFSACKKGEHDAVPVRQVERTVLVYIAANNTLEYDAINSINKMESAAKDLKGNLIVYVKTNSGNSHLLKIKYDNSSKIKSDTIKTYIKQNSSDPAFLKQVILDSRKLSPADTYSLVMWSHATSWAPPSNKKVNSFGYDDEAEMDIKDLKNAIPSDFTYIMFDACSMGSVEVAYELKDKTRYILASPSEVLSESFPYESITPALFGGVDDLKTIARQFVDYYQSYSGLAASATVSLIDTRQLAELAAETKRLLLSAPPAPLNTSALQRLDFERNSGIPAYDFLSFLQNNFSQDRYAALNAQLDNVVIYKAHTKTFFNTPIQVFSGLSVYLPKISDPLKNYYNGFTWASDSAWMTLFY